MPEELTEEYWKQLRSAVLRNEVEKVQQLIEGVDTEALSNHKYSSGNTLLIEAARMGNEETIDVLLKKGIDVNVASNRGKTALGAYVPMRDEQQAKANRINQKLLKAGAIDKTGEYTKSPLIQAIERDDLEEVKKLAAQGDVNAENKDKKPLWKYVLDKPEMLKVLCDAGLDLEVQDRQGHTALMSALYQNKDDVAHNLIVAGADVNAKSKEAIIEGYTPLHFAESVAMTEELIKAGADVNAAAQDGETPMMGKSVEVLKVLHENGADLTVQDSSGMTLMSQAAMRQDIKRIQFLQECGLDINAPDGGGHKPIKYAAAAKNQMGNFATLDGRYIVKTEEANADFVQQMIDCGAKVTGSEALDVVGENTAVNKVLKKAIANEKEQLKKKLSAQRKVADSMVKKVQAESKEVVAETGNLQKSPVRADFQLVNQGR